MSKPPPPKKQFGFLGKNYVSFLSYKKNANGVDNIEYRGDNMTGVCMVSYWNARLRDEKPKTR